MHHPFFAEKTSPRIVGHRGFVTGEQHERGIAENSRAATQTAVDHLADIVESDLRLTSDGVVVMFHDPTLTRTLGDARKVSEVSLAELTELMADRGGLLTLEAALEEFPEAKFNLDMKVPHVAELAGRMIGERASERVLISSFSDRHRLTALAAARAVGGDPATSAGQNTMVKVVAGLALRQRALVERALEGIHALQIPEKQGPIPVFSERLVDAAHARGVEVHVWTVNDPHRMQHLVQLGADGIITDRTDLAVGALRP